MNAPADYLSPNFPTRAEIKRAAFLDAQITAMRARGTPIPPAIVRESQHAMATFRNLPPDEQMMVSRTFNADIAALVAGVHQEVEVREAQAEHTAADELLRDMTKGMVNRPQGLTMEMVGALRAGAQPKLRIHKLPTGAAADARVKQATGLSLRAYEKVLDDLLVTRNMHRYTSPEKYEKELAAAFPGQNPKQADRIVRDWQQERVGLEMQRRNDKANPDSVTMRKPTDSELRRLDLIESIIEVEGNNPKSDFAQSKSAWVEKVAVEEKDSLRGAIAAAFITHDAADLEVELGTIRQEGTDEIIGEEYDNG